MKLVAVSQRVDTYPDRSETRDALDQCLITFLRMAGYLAVPVPNGLHTETPDKYHPRILEVWLTAVAPSAIVLSGGNDIGQYAARDFTEEALLDYARSHQLPALGICRGMQMMAHWAGTRLHAVEGHVQTRHQLSGHIVDDVNSYHSYSLMNCPDGFEVFAHSEDGEIEAIRHVSLPWQGWMWHPEREKEFNLRDIQRLRDLFI